MRSTLLAVLFSLALAGCSEKDARPAKEVVAQAKAVTADARVTAHEAAVSVQASADEAKASAAKAAADADKAVNNASQAVQNGLRELGEGGVVTGRVSHFSRDRLALRPEAEGPGELRVDDHTRYLLHGGTLQRSSLPNGTRVRATYVVEARVPVATEVEVLSP